jgi:hypothetical protein
VEKLKNWRYFYRREVQKARTPAAFSLRGFWHVNPAEAF